MSQNSKTISIERFSSKDKVKKDYIVAILFFLLFLLVGFFEKNLFLSDKGLGLLEHANIWIFLAMNFFVPFFFSQILNAFLYGESIAMVKDFQRVFTSVANRKSTSVLFYFCKAIGFCCFVGNTLQNAHVINELPFDFWDAINYPTSYIASRIYKFYLFSFFIPTVLVFSFIFFQSISKAMKLSHKEFKSYPLVNYHYFKHLCNTGLNFLLVLLLPFMLCCVTVFLIHDRLDITTIATIIISVGCAIGSISMYALMVKDFCVNIARYKAEKVTIINHKLACIHKRILRTSTSKKSEHILDMLIKKETYLQATKDDIMSLNKLPHVTKAIFTSLVPLLPPLLELASYFLKTSANLEALTTIL